MPVKTRLETLILGLAVLLISVAADSKGVSFPGRLSCDSPKKSWRILFKEGPVHPGAFQLILRNSKDATEQTIFNGGRWCDVLWSKDETHLAITDWAASNLSDVLIHDPKSAGLAKSLRDVINMDVIRARFTEDELRGHCYWKALRWESDGRLRFRIFGHTDTYKPLEFAHTFLVRLPEGTVEVLGSTGKPLRAQPAGGNRANQRQTSANVVLLPKLDVAGVSYDDGLLQSEAAILASEYFPRFISGCGMPADPKDDGRFWRVQLFSGIGGADYGALRLAKDGSELWLEAPHGGFHKVTTRLLRRRHVL